MSDETLDIEKEIEEASLGQSRVPQSRQTILARAIKWTTIALCLLGIFVLGRSTANTHIDVVNQEPVSLGKCSPNWQEAKEAGCVYDIILSTWMHPRCFDKKLYDKYMDWLKTMDLKYWLEPEMINEVTFDVVVSGEHGWIWTTGTYHHMHCSYVFDRILEAAKHQPKVLDSLSRNETHVNHCVGYKAIPNWWDLKQLNTTRLFNKPYLVDCLEG